MLAQAKTDAQQPKGLLVAHATSAVKPKPIVLASTAERGGDHDRLRPDMTNVNPLVALAAHEATKPKAIIVAMLPPRHPAQAPRSITDLIEMDTRRTY
jgi:hypothetical protein